MCTSLLYRITELHKVDRSTGKLKAFIYSDKNHDIEKLFGDSMKYNCQQIPCGNCFQCKAVKAREWSFRCIKEAQKYPKNIMLTLTYDDKHIPTSTYVDKETGEVCTSYTLRKDDVTKFMKRLRKKFGDGIRFFMCGEYGSDDEYVTWKGEIKKGTERPHYHIILFNFEPEDMRFYKWSYCDWSKDKNPLFKSKEIEKLWPYGFVDLNEVNKETAEYVARYTTKKLKGDLGVKAYEEKGRVAPYLNMSRRPGIGAEYFEKNYDKFLTEQPLYLVSKKGLVEIPSIRYYEKQMEKVNPEALQDIKHKRFKKSNQHWKDLLSKTDLQKHEYMNNKDIKSSSSSKKLKRVL